MTYDRLFFQVRERSFLDLVDLTFQVLRERPLALSLAAVAGILPCAGINHYLQCDPASSFFFFAWLFALEAPLATAPLTVVLGDVMFDVPLTARRVATALFRGLPALIASQLIFRGLLLLTIVGYLIMPSRYAFLDEVILLERLRFLKAHSRASALCRGHEGEYFVAWLAQIFLGAVFVVCFSIGSDAIISVLFGDELSWSPPRPGGTSGMLFEMAIWTAVAFFGIFRFLSYIDRRIRLEGWELELRLKAAGRGLEENAR